MAVDLFCQEKKRKSGIVSSDVSIDKEVNKMKKNISFSARMLSMMLVLLLCMGTAAIGIPSVSAQEYGANELIYADDVFPGDIVNEGTVLRTSGSYRGVTQIAVYYDGDLVDNSDSTIELERRGKLLSRNEGGGSSIFLQLFFQDIDPREKPDTEETQSASDDDSPSSSTEYVIGKGEVVYADDICPGDIVDEGAILRTDSDGRGVTRIAVYFDNELIAESDYRIVLDRRGMLLSREEERGGDIFLKLFFQDFNSQGEVDSEETLNAAIKRNSTINFSSDIELEDTVKIDDGQTHYINTNGCDILFGYALVSVFIVTNGSTLILDGAGDGDHHSMISGGGGNGIPGGAILVSGKSKLVMKNMTLTENMGEYGGGVYAKNSTVEITKCKFQKNDAYLKGGALYVDENSTATLTECEITGNEAREGAGIINLGTLKVDNCKVKGNTIKYTGSGGGAGIWSKGEATITKTEITQNTNALRGGGITNQKNMTLTDCNISANKASDRGGGIYIDAKGSNTVLDNCKVTNNVGNTGAGINLYKGDLTVKKTPLNGNNATEAGGALWANAGTTADFTDAEMSNNTCKTNGGCLNSHGKLSLNRCTIDGCSADSRGGGIYMDSNDTLTIQSSEITNCMSVNGGAGIYFYAGSLILMGGKTRITDNTTGGYSSNVSFRELKPIQIQGRLSNGSTIGLTPPSNSNGVNATSGFGQYNEGAPADTFFCDNNQFRINRDDGVKEVNLIETMQASDRSSYYVTIRITVTNDVGKWKSAYLRIAGRADRGLGVEKEINCSDNFVEYIDDPHESYTYEYDCGPDYFPTTILFDSEWGDIWPRDFEADVTVKINGINAASGHIVQKGSRRHVRTSVIHVGGDKYPYPDPNAFEIDMPKEIDTSGVITVSAVDQYGLKWAAKGDNVTMENASFPGEDTIESVDKSGFKWKVNSTHSSNHHSVYKMTFKSGSNVYPTITKAINVKFVFPLHLRVIVNDEEVYEASSYANKTVHFENLKIPTGYYIDDFDNADRGILTDLSGKDEETGEYMNSYDFTFINDSVTLTATLMPIYYKIEFDKNGTDKIDEATGEVLKKSADVKGYASTTSYNYDEPKALPNSTLRRTGYTFVGWNTQKDGMGKMFAKNETVLNLSSKKGDVVTLYAIWKPDGTASTTASIFSDGTALIYVGIGIVLLSIAAAVIYYRKKKREGKEQTADEA